MLLNFFLYLSFLSPSSIPIFFSSQFISFTHTYLLFFSHLNFSLFLSSMTIFLLFYFIFSHLSFPLSLTPLYLSPFFSSLSLSLSLSLSYPYLFQNSNLSTNYKFYLSKLLLFLIYTNSKLISFSNICLSFIISL